MLCHRTQSSRAAEDHERRRWHPERAAERGPCPEVICSLAHNKGRCVFLCSSDILHAVCFPSHPITSPRTISCVCVCALFHARSCPAGTNHSASTVHLCLKTFFFPTACLYSSQNIFRNTRNRPSKPSCLVPSRTCMLFLEVSIKNTTKPLILNNIS